MSTTAAQFREMLATLARREGLYLRPVDALDDVPSDAAYSEVIRMAQMAAPQDGDLIAEYERHFTSVANLERIVASKQPVGIRAHYQSLLAAVRFLEAISSYWKNTVSDARALKMAQAAIQLSDAAMEELGVTDAAFRA